MEAALSTVSSSFNDHLSIPEKVDRHKLLGTAKRDWQCVGIQIQAAGKSDLVEFHMGYGVGPADSNRIMVTQRFQQLSIV